MGAVLTPVQIANIALSKFGGGALQTFSDTTPAGAKVAMIYPTVINGLLSEYPWSFTKQTVQLAALAEVSPDGDGSLAEGWPYAFQLPAGLVSLPEKYLANPRRSASPLRDFEVQNQTVYTNVSPVWAVGRFLVDPALWPPYFVKAAVDCLAAELCMTISGNSGMLPGLQAIAWGTPQDNRQGGSLGLAKRTDGRNSGSQRIANDPLTDARYGG